MIALLTLTTALAADVDRVPEDFPTIQSAVDRGQAPTIEVGPGSWAGALVDRPVTILGSMGATIDRGVKVRPGVRAAFGLTGDADRTEITGFDIECASKKLDLGVYASVDRLRGAADAVVVSNNRFHECVQGVTNAGSPVDDCSSPVNGGSYWVVAGNTFDGFASTSDAGWSGGGIGVVLFNATGADVLSNNFTGRVDDRSDFSTTGISLAGCVDCTVADNGFAVTGGKHSWTSVANLGFAQKGGAPSSGLILSDNDATADSAPMLGVNFRSFDSSDVEIRDNQGTAFVDHAVCGDGRVEVLP